VFISVMYLRLYCTYLGLLCVGVRVWFGYGGVRLPAEAQLVYSSGMWGLEVNDRMKGPICFSRLFFVDVFAFSVGGLDIVLFLWNEHDWAA